MAFWYSLPLRTAVCDKCSVTETKESFFFEVETSLAAFSREKSMSWRHHDAIARASTRTEDFQARFSSNTWKVSESTIRSLYINS